MELNWRTSKDVIYIIEGAVMISHWKQIYKWVWCAGGRRLLLAAVLSKIRQARKKCGVVANVDVFQGLR